MTVISEGCSQPRPLRGPAAGQSPVPSPGGAQLDPRESPALAGAPSPGEGEAELSLSAGHCGRGAATEQPRGSLGCSAAPRDGQQMAALASPRCSSILVGNEVELFGPWLSLETGCTLENVNRKCCESFFPQNGQDAEM